MDRSLLAAVTGIDSNQTYLDVIANNIANANTTGFKEDTINFDDLLAQQIEGATAPNGVGLGGVNSIAVGAGVRVGAITPNLAEGTFQQTNSPTDVAINGNGYFIINQGGNTVYTRDGHLLFDANGNMVTGTGGLVQGWQATNTGVINPTLPPGNITIPSNAQLPPLATSNVNLAGNLPSNLPVAAAVAPTALNPVPPGLTNAESSTINIYDQQGNAVPMTVVYEHTGANQWDVYASVQAGGGAAAFTVMGHWQVTFNAAGVITGAVAIGPGAVAGTAATGFQLQTINQFSDNEYQPLPLPAALVPLQSNIGNVAGQPAVTLHIPSATSTQQLTQDNAPDGAQAISQDGYAPGQLSSISIGATGVITGAFTNGQSLSLGQVATAQFANPTGLEKLGDNEFAQTPNSGVALVNTPGAGGSGPLVGGSLEASNVDMAHQLTDLVIAQTSYEANTRVVTTNNTVLNALVNMG